MSFIVLFFYKFINMGWRKTLFLIFLSLILDLSAKKIRRYALKEQNCIVEMNSIKYDLNRFYKKEGYVTQEGDTKYYINICGSVPQCHPEVTEDENIAACELDIKTKNISVTGLTDHMTILRKFDPMPGLSYSYGESGKKKIKVIIEFRCNQHSKEPILKYLVPSIVGKFRNFVFQSRYFCFKQISSYCQITNTISGFNYNLYPLYKKNNDYIIQLNSSSIFLNICGNLSTKLQGACSDESSQICMLNKQGEYTNLGTFFNVGKKLDNEGFFSISFTDGSPCIGQQYIETKIDFECSSNESQPILRSSSSCQFNILWKTKHACPNYEAIHQNCMIKSDHFFIENRNFELPPISLKIPSKDSLSTVLNLHVCTPILHNISVSLHNGNEKVNYGFHNKTILSRNGVLKMKLYGQSCHETVPFSSTIYFQCTYSQARQNYIEIIKTSTCSISLNFYTKLACLVITPEKKSCIIGHNNLTYKLGPLSRLDENYETKDSTGVIYSINLCRPLVYGKHTFVSQNSMICLYNKSAPIFSERYKSLGNYLVQPEYYLNNYHLTAKYTGAMCKNGVSYTSEIQFICDQEAEDKPPNFLFHSECRFVFDWYTKHACPTFKREDLTKGKQNTSPRIETESSKTDEVTERPVEAKIVEDTASDVDKEPRFKNIFIENCVVIDKVNVNKINFTNFPHNIQVTSNQGKVYSLSFCDNNKNTCESPICGGSDLKVPYGSTNNIDLNINTQQQFVLLNLGYNQRKRDFYQSSIMLKCSDNYKFPTIIKEDNCSVHFEWYNNATCALLNINPSEIKTNSSNNNFIISIVVPVLICIIFMTICFIFLCKYHGIFPYYRRIRKNSVIVYYTKNSED